MSSIEKMIRLSFLHRIFFTRGVFAADNPLLGQVLLEPPPRTPCRALAVVDQSLASVRPQLASEIAAYLGSLAPAVSLATDPILVPGGEAAKADGRWVTEVHAQIHRHQIDRHSYVLAVGGGAVLDAVGFAAATAHRGVRHVRFPTTTLSQADSGVGVKNGINAFGQKNFIGTFAPPVAVINDYEFLRTLSPRDMRAGYIEALKVAVIRDRVFFETLEKDAARLARFETVAMERAIRHSAELHVEHIAESGDPFESGSARPLDFGHWSAHKLEQLSQHRVTHGEAVAVGVALDTVYARRRKLIPEAAAERILRLIRELGFTLFAEELLWEAADGQLRILDGLDEFRQHLGGELTLTLVSEIGRPFEVHSLDVPTVVEAIRELRNRQLAA